MSAPINRSDDLRHLRDDGYDVVIEKNYLLVKNVPYVNSRKEVSRGIIVSTLTLTGDITTKPDTHVAFWIGEYPCNSKGTQLTSLVNNNNIQDPTLKNIGVTVSFSHKPAGGYADYYQKMTRYIEILENEARVIDSNATAKIFPLIELTEEESVFRFMDNASSRVGIGIINEKLELNRIAIVGLGGTGSYVLDLVAKTLVKEIHLFDGDRFLQHNAFRSPGAPSLEDLTNQSTKVDWFTGIYSRMRRNIIPHPQFIDESNLGELKQMDFIFLCLEGKHKKIIFDYLIDNKISFIDVGIGMYNGDDELGGVARVTTVTPDYHDHASKRVLFSEGDDDDEYSKNIQIAEMNALNAALAVIKWKKLYGFYFDRENENNSTYSIITNELNNEDFSNEKKIDHT